MPAAAGTFGIRVLEGETSAQGRFHKVHLGALEIAVGIGVHENLDSVVLEHLIPFPGLFVQTELVGESRAASADHGQTEPATGLVFVLDEFLDLFRSLLSQTDHVTSWVQLHYILLASSCLKPSKGD